MSSVLIYFIAGLFVALLFLNIYFRWKVIRVYKNLVKNRVQFRSVDIFRSEKNMQDVFRKYPDSAGDIRAFIYNIRLSVGMAVLIIILITLLGLVLHFDH
jgi:hypothetical protein